jgi:ribosomal protein S18 acetylase RimI-like enzyme
MNSISFRVLESFPEPAYSELIDEAFSDYDESELLTAVSADEAAARPTAIGGESGAALRVGAFRQEKLVGWTYANPEGSSLLYMVNSGVAPDERNRGIYSGLVRLVIEEAKSRGYTYIWSRHAANNNAVIVAKLKLGFMVSGFEYSEVYGPLVRLTYILGDRRRQLYKSRANPIRRLRAR